MFSRAGMNSLWEQKKLEARKCLREACRNRICLHGLLDRQRENVHVVGRLYEFLLSFSLAMYF